MKKINDSLKNRKIARVAVDKTLYYYDSEFDYDIPKELIDKIQVGCRVLVPFGRSNKLRQAIVLSIIDDTQTLKIKSINAVLDKAPLLSDEMIKLAYFMKNRYYCTLFDAFKVMLPSGLSVQVKHGYKLNRDIISKDIVDSLNEKQRRIIRMFDNNDTIYENSLAEILLDKETKINFNELLDSKIIIKVFEQIQSISDAVLKMVCLADDADISNIKLTEKQIKVYDFLSESKYASLKEVCYFLGVTASVVDSLVKKGIAKYFTEEIFRDPYKNITVKQNTCAIDLTYEQKKASDSLYLKYKEDKPYVSLLYGITGSGKTSVFMSLIDKVINDDDGIIVMVPEISLTPQLMYTFRCRYGKKVAIFHSSLSKGERLDEFKRVKKGEVKIAVGTRSAVFAPFKKVKLIIMDEEHEYTYKSDKTPRYHARDIAKFRCNYSNGLLILSSATPSVESYYMAECNIYGMEKLTKRYGNSSLPNVSIVDMNKEIMQGNTSIFSRRLIDGLKENLDNKRQSILLLNRRGYNTFAKCRSCGEVLVCPNCSVSMVYHSDNKKLMCHYCGYSMDITDRCPNCNETEIKYIGFGTQRLEDELSKLLSGARILRMDRDTTMRKFSYENKLKMFENLEYDIMIGTQMVSKGLDFKNVTLVGVLSADQSLYNNDFRSYERTFSLITQVVGRSGRGQIKGSAIIQTFTPENKIIKFAANQDYESFYKSEIKIREAMLYPPFSDICVIGFVGFNEKKIEICSKRFFKKLCNVSKEKYFKIPLIVLEPTAACIYKINNKYRYKLIIKFRNSALFREMMSNLIKEFYSEAKSLEVSVVIDINPDMVM